MYLVVFGRWATPQVCTLCMGAAASLDIHYDPKERVYVSFSFPLDRALGVRDTEQES